MVEREGLPGVIPRVSPGVRPTGDGRARGAPGYETHQRRLSARGSWVERERLPGVSSRVYVPGCKTHRRRSSAIGSRVSKRLRVATGPSRLVLQVVRRMRAERSCGIGITKTRSCEAARAFAARVVIVSQEAVIQPVGWNNMP
eukprot:1192179-Prorocentrum_minimum.AAC.1